MAAASSHSFRQTAITAALWYVALVTLFVALKGVAWVVNSWTWPEMFYGPAIALAVIYAMPVTVAKIENWLKRRRR